ncbi:MAG: hypothetical protein P8R54_21680 [Myxococcota bacterium]|nr:hypothetical protein [Myxococcota bacterium]
MTAVFLVLILAVIGRLLPFAPCDPPWSWRSDLMLALLCGLLVALMGGSWLMPFHLIDGAHFSGDLSEYCNAVVDRAAADLSHYSHNRSLLPAWPAAFLLPHLGLLDAMVASSTAALGVLAAGLYLWGRALHSRMAGVAAALATCALAPLLLLSRMMSFYPETTAVFTLAAGLTAVAVRFSTPAALAAASLGAVLCLLVDLRGLLFALCFLVLIVLAATRAPRRCWPARLAIPALALALGWAAADHAYLPQTAALETQVDLKRRLLDRGIAVPDALEKTLETGYVWGRSDPRQIPLTLLGLQRQSSALPPGALMDETTQRHLDAYLYPWLPLLSGALVVGALGLALGALRWWRLLALLGTAAPFVVAFKGAVELQRAFLRFLATGEPILALLLGLGFAVVYEGAARSGVSRRAGALRLAVGTLLLLLLVLGVVPSAVSPVAPWRTPIPASDRQLRRLVDALESGAPSQMTACLQQLRRDEAAGHSPRGRLYGGVADRPGSSAP